MRKWTADEDTQLLEMSRLKFHRAVIAKALDRTECSVDGRLFLLRALQKSDETWLSSPSSAIQQNPPSL